MANVIFVAPYLLPTTLRFVEATVALPGVRAGLITQEKAERVPVGLRKSLASLAVVEDAVDPKGIATGVKSCAGQMGPIDRILGALEQLQVPLAKVREHFAIPGLSVQAAQNFRDKGRMKTVLQNAGIPCARHRTVTSKQQVEEFARDVGFPLVVKPPDGAAAKDTFRIDDGKALGEYLQQYQISADAPVLLEEFMTGDEHSFDSVVIRGQPVWFSVSRYYPTPLEVMRNPWIQWCVILPRDVTRPEYQQIRKIGFEAVSALGLETGLSHMEWFRRPDGSVAISEVGARPPGAQFTTLISYAHDFDLYHAYSRLMIFGEFDPKPRKYAVGAVFLRGQGQGKVKAIHGIAQAQEEVGSVVVESKLPKVGQPRASTYEGDGYVIVRHQETAVVEQALARLLRTIRVEME